MLYEQGPWWAQEFANIMNEKHQVQFDVYTQNASDEENRNLIRSSFYVLTLEVIGTCNVDTFRVECLRTLSYGRITGTNSPLVKEH